MLFPTIQFAVFFVIVLTANWLLLPNRRVWGLFMLGASYVFYGAWDWRFLGLIVASTIGNQTLATLIDRSEGRRRKGWVTAAVALNLALLGWFKYYGFFATSLVNLFAKAGLDLPLPLLSITLPIGISFFTFQALSYVIDVHRGIQPVTTLLKFGVFLSFFPHVVAGPIVRSSEFLPQLDVRPDPRRVAAVEAFLLIGGGLFKKVVVANTLAVGLVDPVFAGPQHFSALEVLVAIYAYAVQIFADFSGYTDIAIGVALLLGIRFPQNFNQPYVSLSLQDFWRRWHMTLSRWLRDYLYIPLGGNRKGEAMTYRNLILTMLLGGLWHGAAWTFVFWGALHGLGLAWERWRGTRRETHPWPAPVRRLATFHLVCLGWVFFRADSLSTVGTILSRLVDWGPAPALTPSILLLVAGSLAVQFIPRNIRLQIRAGFGRLRPVPMAAALGVFLLMLDGLGPQGVAPFIYFQF